MWATEDFAELKTAGATLAIAGTRTVPLFAPGSARPADKQSVITEFLVDDVDRVHRNLTGFVTDFVNEPTTMPWGNWLLLFRDPDGNLVNFFTPSPQWPSKSSHADATHGRSPGSPETSISPLLDLSTFDRFPS
jgi:predicted enzyme related to lactoylglutathione lyase